MKEAKNGVGAILVHHTSGRGPEGPQRARTPKHIVGGTLRVGGVAIRPKLQDFYFTPKLNHFN